MSTRHRSGLVSRSAVALGLMLALAACPAATTGSAPGVVTTAEQQALRDEAQHTNRVLTGAVGGALVGGLIGALVCGPRDRARCAAIGAVAGGAAGAGVGHYAHVRMQEFQTRQQAAEARIQTAQAEVERYDNVIANTNAVITHHRQEIAGLEQRRAAGQADAAAQRARAADLHADIQAVRTMIRSNEQTVDLMREDLRHLSIAEQRELRQRMDTLESQRDDLERQLAVLESLLAQTAAVA